MKKIADNIWNFLEKVIRAVLIFFFKMFRKEITDAQYEGIIQFVKFGIVGLSNTILSYVLYSVSLIIFQKTGFLPELNYIISQLIAFVLSVAWSFYWNNRVVFKLKEGEERSILPALLKTYVSYSFTGLFLSTALLVLWIEVLGISEFIAPLLNLIISVPLNFFINKFWAFKKK